MSRNPTPADLAGLVLKHAAEQAPVTAQGLAAAGLLMEAAEALSDAHRELCRLWANIQTARSHRDWSRAHGRIDAIESDLELAHSRVRAVLYAPGGDRLVPAADVLPLLAADRPAAAELSARVEASRAAMLRRVGGAT
jgi:hypothetical protein